MSKHKAEYTNSQLRTAIKDGKTVKPVFGCPVGQKCVRYEPRRHHDPRPWTDGYFRYFGWELTVETPHKPGVTDDQWDDQHRMVEDTTAFTHKMMHAAGVAV